MDIWNYRTRDFFLTGMRFFFGIWLLYVGLTKWAIIGPAAFVGLITSPFDHTWSPHALNVALAWVILCAEPLLALLVLSGFRPRLVWTLVSLFLFMLTMGQTILMKPDVIVNWQYLVLALATAALSEAHASPQDTASASARQHPQ